MRSIIFGFMACCAVATAANAQVPSYMPAVIGNAVANAASTQCVDALPTSWVETWTTHVDEVTKTFSEVMPTGDSRAIKRALFGNIYLRWPDGSVVRAFKTPAEQAAVAGADWERRKLVLAGDMAGARAVWKGVDPSGAEVWLTADYVRSFWAGGDWRIMSAAISSGEEPTIPDSFCSLQTIEKLVKRP